MRPSRFDKAALVRLRFQQAEDTLWDAHVLFEQGGSPVSIVNRAYYAIFYATLAIIGTLENFVDTSKHKGVISIFNREFVRTGIFSKEMGRILREAFEARQEGDYREESKIDRGKATEVLKSADEFILTVSQNLSLQGKL